jgi:hypothetical protein
MVLGPLLVALVLRYLGYREATFTPEQSFWLARQEFAAPGQLAAYAQHPQLVTAGHAVFAGACIALAFGVLTVARIVAARTPVLADLGAICLVGSLFGRLYFAGVDLTAFRLGYALGMEQATALVLDNYVELS